MSAPRIAYLGMTHLGLCSAVAATHGERWGLIAATGCNTVYTSTYPYNPYQIAWTNCLF